MSTDRAGRALRGRRPMSGAGPRTARAARKGVCARAPRRAGSAGREVGARASASARAEAGGGRAPGARGPGPPLPPLPSPHPGPPPLGYLICMSPGLASVRARGRGAGAWERAGVRGPCPSAARARGTAPPLGADAGRPLPPLPLPVGPAPAGNKGDPLGPKGRSHPHRQTAPAHPSPSLAPNGKLPHQHIPNT